MGAGGAWWCFQRACKERENGEMKDEGDRKESKEKTKGTERSRSGVCRFDKTVALTWGMKDQAFNQGRDEHGVKKRKETDSAIPNRLYPGKINFDNMPGRASIGSDLPMRTRSSSFQLPYHLL